MSHYADFNDEGLYFKSFEDMKPEHIDAVSQVISHTSTDANGNTIRDHTFKLHDKIKALDSLSKHLGLFKDKDGHDGPNIQVFTGITIINSKKDKDKVIDIPVVSAQLPPVEEREKEAPEVSR